MQYLILCAFSFDSLKKISNFEADYKRTERYGRFNDKEIVFSKSIKAGKRIYYLDVKKNRKDEMFLAITESKKVVMGEGDDSQVSFEKHKIFLYKEDFQKFMAGLTEAISFINHSDMNDYISRLNEEADIKREQEALAEEAQEDKLENEIKIDIDF